MKFAVGLLLCFLSIILTGCFLDAGTHGSIKSYEYKTTKEKLKKAAMHVINNNSNIYRDSADANYIIDVTNGKNDTIVNNHFNDEKNYVSIEIKAKDIENKYTFKYFGIEDGPTVSYISITYANDQEGNGGSDGNGDFPWYKTGLKNRLTEIFEKEFINKIDNELKITHEESE
jgi:hypothetical protein